MIDLDGIAARHHIPNATLSGVICTSVSLSCMSVAEFHVAAFGVSGPRVDSHAQATPL
jgi:hypothetical protein